MKEILKDIDQTVGKTVSEVSRDWGNQCIHFTDDTCIVFICERGYEGDVAVSNDASRLDTADRLDLDIIPEEEADREEETMKKKTKQAELREYQRLHHIYGKAE